MNPIRAKIVKTIEELDRYPFCGHRNIVGKAKHPWTDADHVLSQFGSTRRKGLAAYRKFKLKRSGRAIKKLIEEECKEAGISQQEVMHGVRRREVSRLRATIASRGRTELGLSSAEIARHLGVTASSSFRLVERMEATS